jgi:hypothetical protein
VLRRLFAAAIRLRRDFGHGTVPISGESTS